MGKFIEQMGTLQLDKPVYCLCSHFCGFHGNCYIGNCRTFAKAMLLKFAGDVPRNRACEHKLEAFQTKTKTFMCSVCKVIQKEGATMFQCRPCNYDECEKCYNPNAISQGDQPQLLR